jgi:hyaluronoglucosaminidase
MARRFFGYIEGYYGRMLSWEDRALVVDRMRLMSLNAYLYAPKEDPYHRQQWKIPYPPEWLRGFSAFTLQGKRARVEVVPGLAPGLSYDYRSEPDYAALLKKYRTLIKAGAQTLCLLMDDIPLQLPAPCQKAFASLGIAHAGLLTRLSADLKKISPVIALWFCPTVYASAFFHDDPDAISYLNDLAAHAPKSTLMLWTGEAVISKKITGASLKKVLTLFHGNVCIWDNIYANDYCPHRLFIGPYRNRNSDVGKLSRGMLINPTGLAHTDMFLLSLLSGYVKGKSPMPTWEAATALLPVAKELKTLIRFFDFPSTVIRDFPSRRLASVKKALHRLIWEWKSPLQREWYPFFYMLKTDMELLESKTSRDRAALLAKKYSPLLAALLTKQAARSPIFPGVQ